MGYSAFIIAKEKHLQEKMFSFLEKNLKTKLGLRIGSKGSRSISYTGGKRSKLMIGFDFSSSGGKDGELMYKVLEWMSNKIGKDPGCYFYDGEPSKFSTEKSISKEIDNLFKAHKGKRTKEELRRSRAILTLGIFHLDSNEEIDKEIQKIYASVEKEIKRLDKLWDE